MKKLCSSARLKKKKYQEPESTQQENQVIKRRTPSEKATAPGMRELFFSDCFYSPLRLFKWSGPQSWTTCPCLKSVLGPPREENLTLLLPQNANGVVNKILQSSSNSNSLLQFAPGSQNLNWETSQVGYLGNVLYVCWSLPSNYWQILKARSSWKNKYLPRCQYGSSCIPCPSLKQTSLPLSDMKQSVCWRLESRRIPVLLIWSKCFI